ncbi:MAG TPA: FAD-dependent oxidoreductase, partial [Candidatus Caenarcaniphilales bacterium]
ARLPSNPQGQVEAIAIGNYANDHHYPGYEFALKAKAMRWGGRWTGTPFTIPYSALVPASTDGFLVCEKNISVSHIANGATRLQPVVLGIGQAAGMAAALCVLRGCQPRDLPVRLLQEALLQDSIAPAAVVPLLNLVATHPDWLHWQRYYLDQPDAYPGSGECPGLARLEEPVPISKTLKKFTGTFHRRGDQDYTLSITNPDQGTTQTWTLVTLLPQVNEQLHTCLDGQNLMVQGWLNSAGKWLRIQTIGNTS